MPDPNLVDAGMMAQEAATEATPQKKTSSPQAVNTDNKAPPKVKGQGKKRTASDRRKAMYGAP